MKTDASSAGKVNAANSKVSRCYKVIAYAWVADPLNGVSQNRWLARRRATTRWHPSDVAFASRMVPCPALQGHAVAIVQGQECGAWAGVKGRHVDEKHVAVVHGRSHLRDHEKPSGFAG
jgi:hypothetical protein